MYKTTLLLDVTVLFAAIRQYILQYYYYYIYITYKINNFVRALL